MQEGSKQYRWTSEASASYTIEEDDTDPIEGSGTRLILHMKDEAADYLESSMIEELLKRYSEYIEFPINLWKETSTCGKKLQNMLTSQTMKQTRTYQ
jgi:HSP90 family molecular chaperone